VQQSICLDIVTKRKVLEDLMGCDAVRFGGQALMFLRSLVSPSLVCNNNPSAPKRKAVSSSETMMFLQQIKHIQDWCSTSYG
jgi:hypothetical protein